MEEDKAIASKWMSWLEDAALKLSGGKIHLSKLGSGSKVNR